LKGRINMNKYCIFSHCGDVSVQFPAGVLLGSIRGFIHCRLKSSATMEHVTAGVI